MSRATQSRGAERLPGVAELAARTPASRQRYVDLLRGLAVLLVVLGHWLLVAVQAEDGRLTGENVLAVLGWTHGITWLFQVMPLLFLVGGYVNATSWHAARQRGDDAAAWVRSRCVRVLHPTTAFLGVAVTIALVARWAGVDGDAVRDAAWLSGIGLWFLAAYIAVAAATPLSTRLHEAYGLAVPAAMALGVAAVDVAHISLGVPGVGWLNAALLWGGIHQLGFCWQDGRLHRSRWPAWLLTLGGATALISLTVFGPYPVSMVSVPGDEIQNASPPSFALLTLAALQAGLVLLFQGAGDRWCLGRRRWMAVVTVNAVVLSLYLWHLTAVVAGALLLHGTGLLPQPPVGSAGWYALRPVWIVCLAVLLTVIVSLVARWEHHSEPVRAPHGRSRAARDGAAIAGVVGVCAGLVVLTVAGLSPAPFGGVPVVGLGLFLVGRLLLVHFTMP